MDRFERVVVVVALVVGLAAAGPTAGVALDATDDREPDGPPATGVDAGRANGTGTTAGGGPAAATDPASRDDRATTADARTVRPVVAANRTPNRLSVGPGTVRSGFGRPGADLGAALSADYGEFGGIYVVYFARERLANAETDEQRRAVVEDLLNRTRDRIEALRDREAVAIRSYHNGSIDRRELLRRLASVDAEAGALRAALDELEENNPLVTGEFDTTITYQVRDLRSMEGPVRDRIGRAGEGQSSPGRVHVAASGDGLVLETVGGGIYIREAVRMDNYAPEQPPDSIFPNISERLRGLYPRTFSVEQSEFSLDPLGDRLFVITKSHSIGGLTLYLDRTTGDVYREVQRLRLDRTPTTETANVTGDDLRLVVNRTDDGNPYRVSVEDPVTGAPVDATVSVDGREVGRTGSDGVRWTLGPRGAFNVSATADGERINATVAG